MTAAPLAAIGICALAAALEGVLAGRGVKRRLARLRQPPGSPPFAVWVAIGLLYYLICFVVLSRLLASRPSPLRGAAVTLVIVLLVGNALWNLFFFRLQNLAASGVVLAAYAIVALALGIVLAFTDPVGARVFLPYLAYLGYAAWWSSALRKLNPTRPEELG